MNPFTTDHPLVSKASRFGAKERPMLHFLHRTLALTLIFTPFVLVRLYYYAISDIGAEPNPFPKPWWALFWGSVIAFMLSLVVAVPIMFFISLVFGRIVATICRLAWRYSNR
jgi:hypothetical protein